MSTTRTGVHFCLGAPLARLEARVVLEEMTARFAALTVAEGGAEPVHRRCARHPDAARGGDTIG